MWWTIDNSGSVLDYKMVFGYHLPMVIWEIHCCFSGLLVVLFSNGLLCLVAEPISQNREKKSGHQEIMDTELVQECGAEVQDQPWILSNDRAGMWVE